MTYKNKKFLQFHNLSTNVGSSLRDIYIIKELNFVKEAKSRTKLFM